VQQQHPQFEINISTRHELELSMNRNNFRAWLLSWRFITY